MKQPLQTSEAYNYHQSDQHSAWYSAQTIAPLLVEMFQPQSVADIGCGVGIWLLAFHENGVTDVRGIDGCWVKPEYLVVPQKCFQAADLNNPMRAVDRLGQKLDMVVCLEVAEHLPPDCAGELVDALCTVSDLICFSAAIPGQGGYTHINEQWQSYWAQKFADRGFQAFDIVRPQIAADPEIQFYYRQNIMIYAAPSQTTRCLEASARARARAVSPAALDYVVAEHHVLRTDPLNYSIRDVLRVLPHLVWRTVRSRLGL